MIPVNNLISKDKLRDVLVTKTSLKTGIPVDKVDKVITFIFKDASQAFRTHNSVEISGFGVFKYSLPKMKREIARKSKNLEGLKEIENPSPSEIKRMEILENQIRDVKTKIDELEKD